MLLRSLTKHVRDQNWFAVGLDFFIVVAGILIAFQIANWSEARSVRAETDRTLELLIPTLESFDGIANDFKAYYATTKAYGETALKAWEDQDAISDSEFLVAAYQASQIIGSGNEIGIFAELIGAENIRNIGDLDLQRRLQRYIINPSNITRTSDFDTPYRQGVRRAIPFTIQENIRTECGDQRDDDLGVTRLPTDCDIDLSIERADIAAANLRARTDLRDDLQWHMASVQSVLFDLDSERVRKKTLIDSIKAYIK